MNDTLTREDVDQQAQERLREINLRLSTLEGMRPRGAQIAKPLDGHHHMESVELFDEGVSQGFGYQMDFIGDAVYAYRSGRKLNVTLNTTGFLLFAQGTYTGNGGTLAITGLGFTPKVVIVKSANVFSGSNGQAMIRTNTFSTSENVTNATTDGGIASLDTDGFTVTQTASVNGRTNTNTETYYYYAFGGAGCITGTYVGTGIAGSQVTGLAGKPVMLWIRRPAGGNLVWRTTAMLAEDYGFDTDAGNTNRILSLDNGGGFTLGSDNDVNQLGITYHYMAFIAASNLAVGTFLGNGTDNRTLPATALGFTSTMLHVKADAGQLATWKVNALAGDASFNYGNGASQANKIQNLAIATGQFQLGNDNEVNANAIIYYFFAVTVSNAIAGMAVREDGVLVTSIASTLNFLEPDAALTSLSGSTVAINMALYALLAGRAGGQTLIGGTAADTYLSLRGSSSNLAYTVKLLSPLRMTTAGSSDSGTASAATTTVVTDSTKTWLVNQWAGSILSFVGETKAVLSNTSTALTVDIAFFTTTSGTANAAVTTSNTTLTDTRVTNWQSNALVGAVVTAGGKTMTVTSNTINTLTGAAGWSGGGNPGNGVAWTLSLAGVAYTVTNSNNSVQDSTGVARITVAATNPQILLGPSSTTTSFGSSIAVKIADVLSLGQTATLTEASGRLQIATWPGLNVQNVNMFAVSLTGTQTINATTRGGFQFVGTYELASFNLTGASGSFVGLSGVPTITDSVGTGTVTRFIGVRGGTVVGSANSGTPRLINSAAIEAGLLGDLSAGGAVLSNHAGLRARNQSNIVVTGTSAGLDIEAQGAGSATVRSLRVQGTGVSEHQPPLILGTTSAVGSLRDANNISRIELPSAGRVALSGTGVGAYSPVVTLNTALPDGVGTSVVYTSAGDPILVGHYILIDSEAMLVSAVNTATNTLTVSRGALSTTATSHLAGVAITQTQRVDVFVNGGLGTAGGTLYGADLVLLGDSTTELLVTKSQTTPVATITGSGSMFVAPSKHNYAANTSFRVEIDTAGALNAVYTTANYSPYTTLAADINASTTTVTYTSAGDPVAINDYIMISGEIMLVSNVNAGTNTLTVTRAVLDFPGIAHTALDEDGNAVPIQKLAVSTAQATFRWSDTGGAVWNNSLIPVKSTLTQIGNGFIWIRFSGFNFVVADRWDWTATGTANQVEMIKADTTNNVLYLGGRLVQAYTADIASGVVMTFTYTGASPSSVYGAAFEGKSTGTLTPQIAGVFAQGSLNSVANGGAATGLTAQVSALSAQSGTIASFTTLLAEVPVFDAAIFPTLQYGLRIKDQGNAGSGTVTALQIDSQTAGATATYNIRQQGTTGVNRIAAPTLIGADASPAAGVLLEVQGAAASARMRVRSADAAATPAIEFNDGIAVDAFMRLENRIGIGIDPTANIVLRVGMPTVGSALVNQMLLTGTKTETGNNQTRNLFAFTTNHSDGGFTGHNVRAFAVNPTITNAGGSHNNVILFRTAPSPSSAVITNLAYFSTGHPSGSATVTNLAFMHIGDIDDGTVYTTTNAYGIRIGLDMEGVGSGPFGAGVISTGGTANPIYQQSILADISGGTAANFFNVFGAPTSFGGIAAPATSALIDIKGTVGALLISRLTTAQRDALTAVDGMLAYNNDAAVARVQARENGSWESLAFEKQTEIDFGATPVDNATFIIVDAAVTTGSRITAKVAYEAPTGKDLDEVEMDMLELLCGPGSGQFTLFARGMEGYVHDKFKINYAVA